MRDNCTSLVLIVQLSHGSCLMAGEGETGSLTQAALATSAGICACDSKDALMSFHAVSGIMSTARGEGFRVCGSADHCSL